MRFFIYLKQLFERIIHKKHVYITSIEDVIDNLPDNIFCNKCKAKLIPEQIAEIILSENKVECVCYNCVELL